MSSAVIVRGCSAPPTDCVGEVDVDIVGHWSVAVWILEFGPLTPPPPRCCFSDIAIMIFLQQEEVTKQDGAKQKNYMSWTENKQKA